MTTDERFDRIETLVGALDEKHAARDQALERRLVDLITGTKESLKLEIEAGFDGVKLRLDTIYARLERQGALIQTGSRWTNRMNNWSESVDQNNSKLVRELQDLKERVPRLEQQNPPAA